MRSRANHTAGPDLHASTRAFYSRLAHGRGASAADALSKVPAHARAELLPAMRAFETTASASLTEASTAALDQTFAARLHGATPDHLARTMHALRDDALFSDLPPHFTDAIRATLRTDAPWNVGDDAPPDAGLGRASRSFDLAVTGVVRGVQSMHTLTMIASANTTAFDTPLDRRLLLREANHFRFRYGRYPADHPVQQYVDALAARLPRRAGVTPKIFACPEWLSINACAFPDGTIMVSKGLLTWMEKSGCEQGLLGVLAHEYVHAYRMHAHATRETWQKDKSFLERLLQTTGQERLHEYEADLRGAVDILEELEISYKPFQDFLHHILAAELRRKKLTGTGVDLAHGHTIDRILNLTMLSHLMDMKGLASNLRTPLPADVGRALQSTTGEISYRPIWRAPRGVDTKPADIAARRAERHAFIPTIDHAEILWAAEKIATEHEKDSAAIEDHSHVFDRWCALQGITHRTSRERTIDAYIFFTVCCDTAPPADAQLSAWCHTPADLAECRARIPRILQHAPYVLNRKVRDDSKHNNITTLWSNIVTHALAQQWFGPTKTEQFQFTAFEAWAAEWETDLAHISAEYGTADTKSAAELRQTIAPRYTSRTSEISWNEALDSAIRALAERLAKKPAAALLQAVESTARELVALIPDATLPQLFAVLREIQWNFHTRILTEKSADYGSDAPHDFLLLLTNALLTILPNLQPQSPWERALVVQAIGHKLLVGGGESLEMKSPLIQRLLHHDRVMSEVTIDHVPTVYQYFSNHNYYNTHIGLGYLFNTSPSDANTRTTDYAVAALRALSPRALLTQFDTWNAQRTPIEQFLIDHRERCGPLVVQLLSVLDPKVMSTYTLAELLRLSRLISNPFLRARFQARVKDLTWDTLSFDAQADLLFPPPGQIGISDLAVHEAFIDRTMRSHAESDDVRERMQQRLDRLTTESSVAMGLAVLGDIGLQHHDVTTWIHALLSSQENDEALKVLLYEALAYRDAVLEGLSVVDRVTSADYTLRNLYSLDDIGRMALLRKLLIGPGGALATRENRTTFLHMVFDQWITPEPGEEDVRAILGQIRDALVDVENWEALIIPLVMVLRDEIAQPPAQSTAWGSLYQVNEDLGRKSRHRKTIATFDTARQSSLSPDAIEKPWEHVMAFTAHSEWQLRTALQTDTEAPHATQLRRTPLGFVKEFGSRLGALGVRTLQSLQLFIALKPAHLATLRSVYDQIVGQNKLTLLHVMEREWSDLWDTIATVDERLGGGSMVTVHGTTLHTGAEEVLKVRNPNLPTHVENIYQITVEVLDRLAAHHGGAYRVVRRLVDHIRTWIDGDASFAPFLAEDATFRAWATRSAFALGDYRIRIPESRGTPNPLYVCEERIRATSLTNWETLVQSGVDMKAVVALYARFFLAQIAEGQALSNLHIGNVAVTPAQEVVIYDRNFFVHVNDTERALMTQFFSGSATPALVDQFVQYLTNDHATTDVAAVRTHAEHFVTGMQQQNIALLRESFGELLLHIDHLPLNFLLLVMNVDVLHHMAANAGFTSLAEVMTYQPL